MKMKPLQKPWIRLKRTYLKEDRVRVREPAYRLAFLQLRHPLLTYVRLAAR